MFKKIDWLRATGTTLSMLALTILVSCGGGQQPQQQAQAPEIAVVIQVSVSPCQNSSPDLMSAS